MSDSFTFNANGNNSNIVQGQTVNFTHNDHAADESVSLDRFVQTVAEKEVAPELAAPLQQFAALPVAEQEKAIAAKSPAWLAIADAAVKNRDKILKSLAIFGSAALKSLAGTNPIVAGVLAVCEANKE